MDLSKLISNKGNYIDDITLITPKIFKDKRGFFYESWNENFLKKISKNTKFVQDNHSSSFMGVIRGLHCQLNPYAQGKLVRCTSGAVYDVAVDLRKNSKTFKEWIGIELNEKNKLIFWIPEGFAHGFLTLSDKAEVQYKTTKKWKKESEISILWNDPDLSIQWPLDKLKKIKPIISEKDLNAFSFKEIESLNYLFK